MTESTVTCPYCGTEWPADLELRFCGECGSKLGALSPQITDRERRTLTVLFADISGFTAFSTERDPEAVEAAVDDLLADLGNVVDEYGGYVDKYLGDAMMAVFGAPDAHEDDPLRAVRTGMELLATVEQFNESRDEANDETLSLSVGINTGNVLWSKVGGGDYTVTGDAVNVAKRLEERADVDTVLASEAVQRRTADHIRYERVDPVAVDGRDTPVQAAVATQFVPQRAGERASGPSPDALAEIETPLVGRDTELSRLLDRYEEPGPAFCAVTGPAGIGKSRLLAAFRERLDERTARVEVGHCSRHADLPLEPFGDVLLSAAGVSRSDADAGQRVVETVRSTLAGGDLDPDRRETVAHLLAVSAGLSVPDTAVTDLPPGRLQSEAQRAWLAWLREFAADRPVVLQLEDIQWADEATLALLGALAADAGGNSEASDEGGTGSGTGEDSEGSDDGDALDVTVVATSRPAGDVPDGFEAVDLTPLAEGDAREIAESVLEGPVGDDLPAYLAEHAGGNPYFVAELLRYLLAEGLLTATEEGYRVDADGAAVPESLDGLLVGRIDSLPPAAREAVKGASVVGQRFWRDHLASVLDRDVDGPVETLTVRELVHPREESTLPDDEEFTFEHALLRDAAYGLLPESDRRELHATAATELQAIANGETDVLASRIAAHHEEAGEYEAAAEWYRRAGDAAADAYATGDAVDSYETAIELGEEHGVLDDATVAEIWLGIVETHTEGNEYDRAIVTAEEGLSVAPDRSRQRCQLLGELASAHVEAGEFEQGQDVARRALELATDIGAAEPEARAAIRIASAAEYLGEFERAREYAERGRDVARKIDNREREATALDVLGVAEHRQGEYDRAREHLRRSLELRREDRDRFRVKASLIDLGLVAMSVGEYDRAREYFEESLDIARDIGDRRGEGISIHNLGEVAEARGAYERARECFEESFAIERELDNRLGAAISRQCLGDVAREQGASDWAREHYEASLETCREVDATDREARSLYGLGALARQEGDLDRATTRLDQALSLQQEIGDRRGVAKSTLERGTVALARGDTDAARERAERANETATELDATRLVGQGRRLIGEIAAAEGATDDAREHWRAALDAFEEIDAHEDALATLRELVDACRGTDRDAARAWCERAAGILAAAPQSVVDRHEAWVRDAERALGVERAADTNESGRTDTEEIGETNVPVEPDASGEDC